MQCNSCGSKWESSNIVTTCPFCGANMSKAKEPNDIDISDAIESIIANQGIEALKNSRLVNAHVMDLVKGHDKDKRMFRILCSNGAMEFAYKIAKSTDSSQKEIITKKQIKVLVDDAFLAEDNAIAAINIILKGLGEKEFQTTPMVASMPINEKQEVAITQNVLTTTNNDVSKPSPTGELKNKEKLKSAKVGGFVKFGMYEQSNNTSNGKEEIEWLVLEKQDNKILVISKYALDCQPYNEKDRKVTWETCTLRKWLNNDFIKSAFTADEQAMIPTVIVSADENPKYRKKPGNTTQDKIFLLSITEANKYFAYAYARKCAPTDYAIEQGAYKSFFFPTVSRTTCWWWLRSPRQ